MSPESEAHLKIKELVRDKLKEWYGASITEYYNEGHELDVYAVTSEGYSIYVEVIWDPSKVHFKDDLLIIQRSDADIILTIVNPEILKNPNRVREFEKTLFSKRKSGKKMSSMMDGQQIIENAHYLNDEMRETVNSLIEEKRGENARKKTLIDQQKKAIFRESKEILGKSSLLIKGHLKYLKEEGDKYHAKNRIPMEINNITKHSSILSSIGSETEKNKIEPIIQEGKKYGKLTTTDQFLKYNEEISKWADEANSIEIDIS
jgi:hypothetical protein